MTYAGLVLLALGVLIAGLSYAVGGKGPITTPARNLGLGLIVVGLFMAAAPTAIQSLSQGIL